MAYGAPVAYGAPMAYGAPAYGAPVAYGAPAYGAPVAYGAPAYGAAVAYGAPVVYGAPVYGHNGRILRFAAVAGNVALTYFGLPTVPLPPAPPQGGDGTAGNQGGDNPLAPTRKTGTDTTKPATGSTDQKLDTLIELNKATLLGILAVRENQYAVTPALKKPDNPAADYNTQLNDKLKELKLLNK